MSEGATEPVTREVDARYLEPPEPFVLAMEALDSLAAGERLRLLLFREPFPLYKVLEENGFSRQTTLQDDGTYEILIRHAGDAWP
jgi:tRNA 2-thiouridine synthesizing protein A